VLELGCGHGVAVSLVCERLEDGHVLGIDSSQKMIDAATRRNRDHIAAGKATLVCVVLEAHDFGSARFDKIFGIHFSPHRHNPAAVLALVEPLLAPGGVARFL
jgi:SAM-dependent methyltransferase